MRSRIRKSVVENSTHIKHYKFNNNALSNKDFSSGELNFKLSIIKLTFMFFLIRKAVLENTLYTKYYKVSINALSNKDVGSVKIILYYVLLS
jgi:hypothetical protein